MHVGLNEEYLITSLLFLQPISTEILEYSSDSDKEDDPKNDLFIDSESPHKYQVDFKSDARQSLNRQPDSGANSTQPILSTPQKYMAKFSKTTENSATKKKFLRLNHLYNFLFLGSSLS